MKIMNYTERFERPLGYELYFLWLCSVVNEGNIWYNKTFMDKIHVKTFHAY